MAISNQKQIEDKIKIWLWRESRIILLFKSNSAKCHWNCWSMLCWFFFSSNLCFCVFCRAHQGFGWVGEWANTRLSFTFNSMILCMNIIIVFIHDDQC